MTDRIDVLAVMDRDKKHADAYRILYGVIDASPFELACESRGARDAVAELIEALEYALRESGCDGDMCMHFWHERARKIIDKVRRP